MKRGPIALTGGQGSRSTGVVSGFVLKLARQSAALTQDQLAEALAVDVTTVQGWESGRRPLAATHAGDFLRLSARLSRLGAPPSTRRHLTEAIEADQVLSAGITGGGAVVHAETHPLAARVHRRTLTNLITWPITRTLPQQLEEFASKVPRRGPVASHPSLAAEEQHRFFDHLLTVVERGRRTDEPLLRRQAVYLLGFDGRLQVVDWLRDEWRRAWRSTVRDGNITGLLEARSASVALASAGDSTHIHDFVDQTIDTRAEVANLNYWAHWIGELSEEQTSDAFMSNDDTRSWTGVRLLHHLINRLDPNSSHLPLNLHTLHVLIASRPALLAERTDVRKRLAEVLDKLASSGNVTRTGRGQVVGLQYALRIADR
ncbi:helix-turn-helix transcriptional regulator [Actinophytocola sp.]|jgi:transcriptional regulator with XRE-family HTH domain|uniref:helix-turn-helix domain-containing protein n=1 Tax=Actinophytocola sp. TaxID=1872138 RepID=UPI002ED9AC1B